MPNNFCPHLRNKTCSLLNEECFRLRQQSICDFLNHYHMITNYTNDPPITQIVKKELLQPFLEKWKSYAASPSPGKKNMIGQPLEQIFRKRIKEELENQDVLVYDKAHKFEIGEEVSIYADVFIEKEGYPISIVSVKSWIGTTQIRETFAYAYLSKLWNGQKNVRLFMATLHPIEPRIKRVESICKPYLDGLYSITSKPYFDELIVELKKIYS